MTKFQHRNMFKNNLAIPFKQYFWSGTLCAFDLKENCKIKRNMKIRTTNNKVSVICLSSSFFILKLCAIFQVQLHQIAKSSFFFSSVWKRWNLKQETMVFICFALLNTLSILCTIAQQKMHFELWCYLRNSRFSDIRRGLGHRREGKKSGSMGNLIVIRVRQKQHFIAGLHNTHFVPAMKHFNMPHCVRSNNIQNWQSNSLMLCFSITFYLFTSETYSTDDLGLQNYWKLKCRLTTSFFWEEFLAVYFFLLRRIPC